MEAPDEQDDGEEKKNEKADEKKRKKTEGDDEEEDEQQEASSSSRRFEPSSSSRGPDADAAANGEENIFRPSISDRVATSLLNFGINPANYAENYGDMENDTTWFVLGSMRTMVVWGLAGIPIYPQEFDEFRTRHINEGHGPEVSITLACKNLNERTRSLEYQRDPDLRSDIRAARNTLRYLQYLLLLRGRQDPLAYHSATITFNKWMENGSSLDFSRTTKQVQEEPMTQTMRKKKQRRKQMMRQKSRELELEAQ